MLMWMLQVVEFHRCEWVAAGVVAVMLVTQLHADELAPKFPNDQSFQNVVVRSRVSGRFEIYNPHSAEDLQAVHDMGFRQVILDWPNLHADATRTGLDVVMANWWTIDTEDSEIAKQLESLNVVDPERLVAISMMDEPERNSPQTPFSFYQALYGDLKKTVDQKFPGVRLEISHWGPLRSWSKEAYEYFIPLYQSTDLVRLMPYPDLREGPLSEVFYQMMRSRHVMQLAGREIPQLVILQTWVLPENPKLPTIAELRVMAYQAILSGSTTLSFFSYEPETWARTPGFTEGFRGLMRELTTFSDRHQGQQVETTMDASGILKAVITRTDGSDLTVRVNTNRSAAGNLSALAIESSWLIDSTSAQSVMRANSVALANPVTSANQSCQLISHAGCQHQE